MHIRLLLPNNTTKSVTAALSEGVKVAIKPRDNFAIESVGAIFEVGVSFVLSADNHKALQYGANVTATSSLRQNGCTAFLFDGTSEIRGRFTLVGAKVTSEGAAYSGTFTVGAGDWLAVLKNLNDYDFGTFTHNRTNIEAIFAGGASPMYFHQLYYQTPMHPASYFDIMECAPSIYIKSIIDKIFENITATGYNLDAPLFETDFFKSLLLQKFKGWANVPNIYATEKIGATYFIANPATINVAIGASGEFLPFTNTGAYGETQIDVLQTQAGLITGIASHPVMPFPIPHYGSYANIIGDYAVFTAPQTGYYNIAVTYDSGKSSNNETGFFVFKNGVPFSDLAGQTVSKLDSNNTTAFGINYNTDVFLTAGDALQWCRHEQRIGGGAPDAPVAPRYFLIQIAKQNAVYENTAYHIKDLLPADNAALFLRGLFETFNLVVNTHGTTITIAPMFDAILYTGETVQGFYKLNGKQTIHENCNYIDSYKGNERHKDYYWSYKDDSKDVNINKGQLFSGHLLYPKNTEPQRQFDNSYFAPTYSEGGICYILTNSNVQNSYLTWQRSTYDHTPRLLYKIEPLVNAWEWYEAGNFLPYRPVAFLADPYLAIYPLTLETRGTERGLIQRFWQSWATWLQTTFERVIEHTQLPFNNLDVRTLAHLYGAWWLVESVENIDLGCDSETTGEPMTVKLQFIDYGV